MKYLSCKAESSISTSDSTKTHLKKPFKIQEFYYKDLEYATNGFSDDKLLGRGSHGSVYKALLPTGQHVAVKKPSRASHNLNPTEVDNEIDILSNLHSPRLVNLLGFTNDHDKRLLVVEYMSNGTLYDALHTNRCPPNWGRRIKLALQMAKAVSTLHCCSPPVIHRDIKSANVLMDRSFNARLGDFGLALRCHVDDYKLLSTPPAGTMGYLDPCYVTPDNLSTKTDVFSFGILLLEIISGRKAIDVAYSPPSIVDWAVPLIRRGKLLGIYDPRIEPPRDGFVRKQLGVIAAKCVRSCRERRPSMREVVECLSELSKFVPLNSWNGFTNPCMMVESVGVPVESRKKDGDDAKFVRQLKNSKRVYSDLGFRHNLLDLMAKNNELGESNAVESKSKSKNGSESERVVNKSSVSRLRRNQSFGDNFDIYLRKHNSNARSSSNAQPIE